MDQNEKDIQLILGKKRGYRLFSAFTFNALRWLFEDWYKAIDYEPSEKIKHMAKVDAGKQLDIIKGFLDDPLKGFEARLRFKWMEREIIHKGDLKMKDIEIERLQEEIEFLKLQLKTVTDIVEKFRNES